MKNAFARVGLVLIGLACCAGTARAGTVNLTASGTLSFTSNANVGHVLTIAPLGGIYLVSDPSEPITLSLPAVQGGCLASNANSISCPIAAVTFISILTGPAADSIVLTGVAVPTSVEAGPSGDVIVGGDGDDAIVWNPGGGSDTIDGGPGNDSLFFQGSVISENINIAQEDEGFALLRDIGQALLHVDGVENLTVDAHGGFDNIATVPLRNTAQHIATDDDATVSPDALGIHAGGLCVVQNGTSFAIEGRPPITSSGMDFVLLDHVFCRPDPCDGALPTTGCTVNGVRDQPCQGTDGDDTIVGTKDGDVILGGGGADRIRGGAGDDLLCGEAGDDTLIGARGNDVIFGGPGLDTLRGDSGNDTLVGGDDADLLTGGSGADDLDGGLGDDRLRGGAADDTLRGGDGLDVLDGASGTDTCGDTDQSASFPRCELLP